jgi:mycothiol system anti-sigma-R factor
MGDCNCEEALQDIQRYLDGECDDSLHQDIQQHLSDCGPCMQRAEFRKHLKVMISSKCAQDEVPAALMEKINGLLGSS